MLGLDREVDDSPPDLNCFVIQRKERSSLLDKDESTKLGRVVLEHEFALLQFDLGMAPRHGDVVDAQIRFVTSTELEDSLGARWLDDVDNTARILLLTETFEHKVIARWLLVLYKVVLQGLALVILGFDHERVCTLADFAFKCLPEERGEVS